MSKIDNGFTYIRNKKSNKNHEKKNTYRKSTAWSSKILKREI